MKSYLPITPDDGIPSDEEGTSANSESSNECRTSPETKYVKGQADTDERPAQEGGARFA
jgi:hypothetical protein